MMGEASSSMQAAQGLLKHFPMFILADKDGINVDR